MEKVKNRNNINFFALGPLDLSLGFDEIARDKIKKQLKRSPPENSLDSKENEYLMFILTQSIFN